MSSFDCHELTFIQAKGNSQKTISYTDAASLFETYSIPSCFLSWMGTWGARSPKPSLALGTWLVPENPVLIFPKVHEKIWKRHTKMSNHTMPSDITVWNSCDCHHQLCWVLGFQNFERRSQRRLEWSCPRRASRFVIGAPAAANGGCHWLRSTFLWVRKLSCYYFNSAILGKHIYDISYSHIKADYICRQK